MLTEDSKKRGILNMNMGYLLYGVIAVVLIVLVLKILTKPIKLVFKILIHAGFGLVTLWIFNFLGAWFNLSLDYSFLNCLVAGVLGVPGVIILGILKFLAII